MAAAPIPITLVVVGDGGVGKSSLTTSLLRRKINDEWDPTIEDSYTVQLNVDGQEYDVSIVDTAGQEEYRGLWGEATVREGDGFICVYSVDSASSWEILPQFMHTIRKVKSDYEDPTENPTPQNTPFPFIIIGNKCDLPPSSRKIPAATGLAFAKTSGGLFVECSAKLRVNIDSAFTSIIRKTAQSKKAREEWAKRRGGKTEGFNGNIAMLDLLSPNPGAGFEEEKPRKKPNPALAMDRNRTKSVGGLAGDRFDDDEKTAGGCCTIA